MSAALLVVAAVSQRLHAGANDTQPALLIQSAFDDRYPVWHPQGDRIAFESNRDGPWHLFLKDRRSEQVIALTSGPQNDRYPAWHPDGRGLLFVSDRAGFDQLMLLDVETGRVSELSSEPQDRLLFPAISHDGRQLAVTRARDMQFSIVLRELDDKSGEWQRLPLPMRSLWPRWQVGDAALTLFARVAGSGDQDDVFVFDLGSQSLRRLTETPGHDFCPAWSPDGRHIAYVSIHSETERGLRVQELTSGRHVDLAPGFHRITEPHWSPDGRAVLFAAKCASTDVYDIYLQTMTEGRFPEAPTDPSASTEGAVEPPPIPATAAVNRACAPPL